LNDNAIEHISVKSAFTRLGGYRLIVGYSEPFFCIHTSAGRLLYNQSDVDTIN